MLKMSDLYWFCLLRCYGLIAYEIEEVLTLNQRVVGSSPTAPTNEINDLDLCASEKTHLGVPMGFQRCRKSDNSGAWLEASPDGA